MLRSIRATHEPKQVTTDAAEELEKDTTDKPTESNHPKYRSNCAEFDNGHRIAEYSTLNTQQKVLSDLNFIMYN